jgi:Protein of unknown function (DUF3617)
MLGLRVALLALWLGAAALAPALAADNTPLAVKPGLWEMTSDSEHSGAPPIPPEALAKLTPEQRQKFEAAMKGAMGPQHHVMKHCMTQADIDKGFEPDRMGQGKCTQNVTASTATLREGSFTCAGRGGENSSGSYHFEARSPEAVAGTWDMTMNGSGNTMKMKSTMQGKWLGGDCGDTK